MVRRGDGVCISISFNFCAWYRVEIRFSDNPRQKNTIDHIIWFRRKKCVIYRLDLIFGITHVVQLMVSEINLFCQRISVEEYRKKDTKLHIMSGSWKIAMAYCFYVTRDWDIWRNCSLCLRKRVTFQTWGAKMFLTKFY